MRRVRMFCDWDDDSRSMIEKFKKVTYGFDGDRFKDTLFVDDDTYTHAVVFNFPVHDLRTPPEKNIALLVEPPEIIDALYGSHKDKEWHNVCEKYSFANHPGWRPALGVGFATADKDNWVTEAARRPNRMCMIVSDKHMTPFHHKRHEIKDALLQTNVNIHFYGRNLHGADDRIKGEIAPMAKNKILADYQFCIDFENSPAGAVTDKFFDPILCGTIPVTNAGVLKYLAPNSTVQIDFEKPVYQIMDDILEAYHHADARRFDIQSANYAVTEGHMNLTNWVNERVKLL